VNNETFLTSLRLRYQIIIFACYMQCMYFFLVDGDTSRNFNIHKCYICKVGTPPSHPLIFRLILWNG